MLPKLYVVRISVKRYAFPTPFRLNGSGFLLRGAEHALNDFPPDGAHFRRHICTTVSIFRMGVDHVYSIMRSYFLSNGELFERISKSTVVADYDSEGLPLWLGCRF